MRGAARGRVGIQLCRLGREESGQAALMALLALGIAFVFMGLAFDVGVWYLDHRLAQTQVDAAVLAAVQFFPGNSGPGSGACTPPTNATDALKCSLTQNGAKTTDLEPCASGEAAPFIDGTNSIARACLRRKSVITWLGLAGKTTAYVSARAQAQVVQGGSLSLGLMALDPSDADAFKISGGAKLTLNNGAGTYTRSSSASPNCGLDVTGSGSSLTSTSGLNYVVGCSTGGGAISPTATKYRYLSDPFGTTPSPPTAGTCTGGTIHLDALPQPIANPTPPGILCYSGKVDVRSGKTATLAKGVYIFQQSLDVHGILQDCSVTPTPAGCGATDRGGVLLYFTCPTSPCNNLASPAGLSSASGAQLTLLGNPTYQNLMFWGDRTAQSCFTVVKLVGGTTTSLTGIIYAPRSIVDMGGGGGSFTLNTNIVAGKISLGGGTTVTMTYDGTQTIRGVDAVTE